MKNSILKIALSMLFVSIILNACKKPEEKLPVVTTNDITEISSYTATCGGNVTDEGDDKVITRGVCWSISENPTILDYAVPGGSELGAFVCNLVGLTENTTYYVRAYATNSIGTSYGEQKSFVTKDANAFTIETNNVTNIKNTSAKSGGVISNENNETILSCGVCWNTLENPTISNSFTVENLQTGSFESYLTGLQPNTTYYLRAYITGVEITTYGEQLSFTTTNASLPSISTLGITDVTNTSATCSAEVTDQGGGTVTTSGVCWSTSENPTITDNYTRDGSNSGVFYTEMTDLSESTTYYVRAYAVNETGTSYGEQIEFFFYGNGTLLLKDFEDQDIYSGGWTTKQVIGDFNWEISYWDNFAQISNYNGTNNNSEVWYISPLIETGISSYLSFKSAYYYSGAPMEVKYSTNYDGGSNPNNSTWTDFNPTLSSGSWVWTDSGSLALPANTSIYIAFVYKGTDTDGSTWEIDDILIGTN